MENGTPHPSFREALLVWIKIGILSFGGPAGQIALMHRELVETRRWISDRRFLHALNYCMLLPGPEAQQLAIYTGWLLHKTPGGIVAGALFVLPGAVLMWIISCVYVYFGNLPVVEAVFYGLKAAVMAVVASAMMRIGKKVLKYPGVFPQSNGHGTGRNDESGTYVISDRTSSVIPKTGMGRTLTRISFWLVLWLMPPLFFLAWFGETHLLAREGVFFSKAALVTFGGAYAVLPYVAQQAVEVHGWLTAEQMMDGLGLAETTPGPLILVLQFVGFLAAWNHASGVPPLLAATLATALTVWCTFIPGYLFIFAGAPHIERSRGDLRLDSALSAMTAAVVGVIVNLAVWFGWHAVMPEPGRFDPIPLVLAAAFFLLLTKRGWGVIPVVGLGATSGLAMYLAGLV